MSVAVKCDRCGRYYDDGTFGVELINLEGNKTLDLCEDCFSELETFLTSPDTIRCIIRCKQCKWYDSKFRECNSPNWDTGGDQFVLPEGFYCGWGEK